MGGFGMKFESIRCFVKRNIIVFISVLFGIISLLFSFVYTYFYKCEECDVCDLNVSNVIQNDSEDEKGTYVLVDVKGAVKKAGVYSLLDGSTVNDAIKVAGGLTSNGVTSNINLSKKVKDEMVIYVFSKSELKEKVSSNAVCEVPKCECETVVVDREICTSDNQINGSSGSLISINTASLEELMSLDGIGESKAKAIIEYRNANGNFSKIEDIMNVSGIGEKAFEAIKNKITV